MKRMSDFSYFLRTGRARPPEPTIEQKFNPWHDPDDGRFTFVGQGRYYHGGQSRASSGGSVRRPSTPRAVVLKPSLPKAPERGRPNHVTVSDVPGPGQDSGTRLTSISAALERTQRELGSAKTTASKWRTGGKMGKREVEQRAANAMRMYHIHIARGMTPDEAAAWAANAEAESRGDYRAVQPGGPGRGLFQWGNDEAKFDRRRHFQRLFGRPIEKSTEAEQLAFRDWELANTEISAARKIAKAQGAANISSAIVFHYERPQDKEIRAIDRANIAEEIIRMAKKLR